MDGRENIGMEDKKLFWISDVAKMFHVSAGTLRHYEQAGLLAPEYTGPDTGYRYYGIRQFEVLEYWICLFHRSLSFFRTGIQM